MSLTEFLARKVRGQGGAALIESGAMPASAPRRIRLARHLLIRTFAKWLYLVLHPIHRAYGLGACEVMKERFQAAGEGLLFDPTTSVFSYEQITVGRNVFIGWGAYFFGPITIGDDIMFGPKVHLQAGYHRIDLVGRTIRDSGSAPRARIVIEDDVWIGARTSVMRGVTVGQGSVIGTESLVLRDIPPYVVAVGNPCKPARKRFSDDDLRSHLQILGVAADQSEALIQRRSDALDEG